jgi:hypothetical protein
MPEINICNSAGRDAIVKIETVAIPLQVRWIDSEGRQARSVRFLKSTLEQDIQALQRQAEKSACNVAELLIRSDPDVDIESAGSFLFNTSRVYVNSANEILHRSVAFHVVRDPDGKELDRRPADRPPPNVSCEIPLRWSNIYRKKTDIVRRFVLSNKLQLSHVNGLTYDFLYQMAADLERLESMLVLGSGPKSNQPLILRRGSIPYRGFLEGRTEGEKYLLLLHLSNLELKSTADQPRN